MEELLHQPLYMKPCEKWNILNVNWCRMSSINSISYLFRGCSLCFWGGTGGLHGPDRHGQHGMSGDSLKLDQCENDLGGPKKKGKRSEPGSEASKNKA